MLPIWKDISIPFSYYLAYKLRNKIINTIILLIILIKLMSILILISLYYCNTAILFNKKNLFLLFWIKGEVDIKQVEYMCRVWDKFRYILGAGQPTWVKFLGSMTSLSGAEKVHDLILGTKKKHDLNFGYQNVFWAHHLRQANFTM